MNSKSLKSPGLVINGNSLLILPLMLPPLTEWCIFLLLAFSLHFKRKQLQLKSKKGGGSIRPLTQARTLGLILPNNTHFLMRLWCSGSFYEEPFHLWGGSNGPWASKLNRLASDVLYAGLMRVFPVWVWSKLKVIQRETVKLCYVERQVRTRVLDWYVQWTLNFLTSSLGLLLLACCLIHEFMLSLRRHLSQRVTLVRWVSVCKCSCRRTVLWWLRSNKELV